MDARTDAHQVTPAPIARERVSRRGKIVGTIVALVALAALGWLAWDLTHQPTPPSNAPAAGGRRGASATTVGVATAERADIPVVLEALGTVTPAATATVRSQVSGVLKEVLYKEGQTVKAGQLLATVDPRQFEMAVMQASGQRMKDEAQLENARLTLQRFRTLLEQDSIARQEVDTQAALVKQLEATVVSDRAAEGTARLSLGYSRIVAPISGRVGLRVVDIGNVVGTNDANGVAVITQISPIDVEFAVPQDQVPEVQARANAGARMPVTALDRTRTTVLDTGTFSTLDNQVDTQTGTVRAKARFANAKLTLFPSQFVNVRLLLRTIEGAIVVPVTALRHGNSGDFVYVLNEAERTVGLRPVTRGQATVDKIVITSGLQAGEKVITEGADRLKDGSNVILAGDAPASGAAPGTGRRQGARGGTPATAGAGQPADGTAAPAPGSRRRSNPQDAGKANDAAGAPARGPRPGPPAEAPGK